MSSKRPASSGSIGNAAKCKHVSISIQQNVELLQKLEKGTLVRALCEFYNVGSSTVYDLKKQKNQILKFLAKISLNDGKSLTTFRKEFNLEDMIWTARPWDRVTPSEEWMAQIVASPNV
uniref:HTH psq-type domain-containing protein n=1 Tax=Chelydra serpentina TaxID=8475 RepID=A0A8C3S8B1_CHESE